MAAGFKDDKYHDAYVELLREHGGIIHRMARLYSDCREDEEDLEQEIRLQLWRSFPSFAGRSKASTWFYSLALNVAISFVRAKKRRPPQVPLVELGVPVREEDRRVETLNAAMRSLPDVDRAIMMLWLEERSYREMAEILGISEGAVSLRLVRARERLRDSVRGIGKDVSL